MFLSTVGSSFRRVLLSPHAGGDTAVLDMPVPRPYVNTGELPTSLTPANTSNLIALAHEINTEMRRHAAASMSKGSNPPAGLISLVPDPKYASLSFSQLEQVSAFLSGQVRILANGLYKGQVAIGAKSQDRVAQRKVDGLLLDFPNLRQISNNTIADFLRSRKYAINSSNINEIVSQACGPEWSKLQSLLYRVINNKTGSKLKGIERTNHIDRLLVLGSDRMGLLNAGNAGLLGAEKAGVQEHRIAGFDPTAECPPDVVRLTYAFAYPDALIQGLMASLNDLSIPIYDPQRPTVKREKLISDIIDQAQKLMEAHKDKMAQSIEDLVCNLKTGGQGAVIMVNDGKLGDRFKKAGKVIELLVRPILKS